MGRTLSLFGVAVLLLGSIACSRAGGEKGKLTIQVPVAQSVSSLTGTYKLDIAILNVKAGAATPYVDRIESHDDSSASYTESQSFAFTVNDVAIGAVVNIQVLAVYRNDQTGAMKFLHQGVLNHKVEAAKPVVLNITDLAVGGGIEAQVAGRYLTAANVGPTGKLKHYVETRAGFEPMLLESAPIVNGWFHIFAVQGVKFDFVLDGVGTTVFDDVTLDASGDLMFGSSLVDLTDSSRLQVVKPASFRVRDNANAEAEGEARLILGFFDNQSDSLVVGKNVLLQTESEGLSRVYTDSTLSTRIDFTGLSGTGVRHVSGGTPAAFADIFTRAAAGCGDSEYNGGDCLQFYPSRLNDGGREGFSGMEIPFRVQRPHSIHGGCATSEYKPAACAGADCVRVKWDLLPGTEAALGAVEVWGLTSGSGFDGGDDDDEKGCSTLASKGLTKFGEQTNVAANEYFDHAPSGMNSGNYHQYSYVLCARLSAAHGGGYIGRPLRVDHIENGGGAAHFGWALSTANTTVSTSLQHAESRKVDNLPVTTSALYNVLSVGAFSPSVFDVNNEVLIHVSSARGSGCGPGVSVGRYGFARVLAIDGASGYVKIAKGTFVDSLAGVSAANFTNATSNSGLDHCYLQVARVNHYNDLTLQPAAVYRATAFQHGASGGAGLLPIRIAGTLSLGDGAKITATGYGYEGGAAGYHGAGADLGPTVATQATMGGKRGSSAPDFGGGGGGFGQGGYHVSASAGDAGAGNSNWSGGIRMIFGGGGGASGAGESGGTGGGVVFVVAKSLEIPASAEATIEASGAAVSATTGGGGGGGGSVYVMTEKTVAGDALSKLEVYANGGDADPAKGGAGGQGSVHALICENTLAAGKLDLSATIGLGQATGIPAGLTSVWLEDPANAHQCRAN